MKKNQIKAARVAVLGYSAAMALAGGAISLDAVAACTAGTATSPVVCNVASGDGPFAEAFSFTGSNNVIMGYTGGVQTFGACGYHVQGKNSFGLSLNGGSMTVRNATGKTADEDSGCIS